MLRILLPALFLGIGANSPTPVVLAPGSSPAAVSAPAVHCQVPCGIYGDKLRIDMLMEDAATIEKAMAQLIAMDAEASPSKNQMVRWVLAKEDHAQSIQDTVAAYWMAQRIKAPAADASAEDMAAYHQKLGLLHGITVAAMKCKQTTDSAHVDKLRNLAQSFSRAYFSPEDLEHMGTEHAAPAVHGEREGDDGRVPNKSEDSNEGQTTDPQQAEAPGSSPAQDARVAEKPWPLDKLPPKTDSVSARSFERLSLEETDVEALLDNIFPIDGEEPPPYAYPKGVQKLDGQDIELIGYMIPLTWDDQRVLEFMLVRDLAACCFGGIPQPDEWVFVTMDKGAGCAYFPYVPVQVSGLLSLYPLGTEADPEGEGNPDAGTDEGLGTVQAVYSIRATEVEKP